MRKLKVLDRVCLRNDPKWTFRITKVKPRPDGDHLCELEATGAHRKDRKLMGRNTDGVDYESNLRLISPRAPKPRKGKADKWAYKDCHILKNGRVMLHDNHFQLKALKWLNAQAKEIFRLKNGAKK